MKRMILHKLTLSGKDKQNAILQFNKGLNVITGDSDTGKTFAFHCIDYMLGRETPPKNIIEAQGYTTCELEFFVDEIHYKLQRNLGEKRITVINCCTQSTTLIPCKHDPNNNNNLSKFLLNILLEKNENIKILKNIKKEQRTLSFRDLVHLCLISETNIIAESSAFQSIQYTEKTARASILDYLITGNDAHQPEEKIVSISNKAKQSIIEYLEQQKTKILNQISAIKNNNKLKVFMENRSLQDAITKINVLRTDLSTLQNNLNSLNQDITNLNLNCLEDETKLSEFNKLQEYYTDELNKITTLSTYQYFKSQLPNLPCPFCKQIINLETLSDADITNLYDYWTSNQLELQEKKKELALSIAEINNRLSQNQKQLQLIKQNQKDLISKIKIKEDELNNLSEYITDIHKYEEMCFTLKILEKEHSDILETIAEYKNRPHKEKKNIAIKSLDLYDKYCEIISKILKSWGVSENPSVEFDRAVLDLIINGKNRVNWGKGYRAFIMTAMAIGLMRYCFEYNRLHPGFVIVDSPLVSLKERKKSNDEWIETYMEQKMIKDILDNDSQRQVIIFENKDLKFNLNYNYIEFNHDGDLKGFIPNN